MPEINEPPFNPDEDTSPSLAMRPVDADMLIDPAEERREMLGWLSLFGAVLFTMATIVVLLIPQNEPDLPQDVEQGVVEEASPVPSSVPTQMPTAEPLVAAQTGDEIPVVDPQQLNNLLEMPLPAIEDYGMAYVYNPFTVISGDRPRSEFLDYTAVQGDTINAVAERYNLAPESIAWCNDRRIIQALRPNDVLRIPPVDGACHRVLGTREETMTSVAERFAVDDPYIIIDSPYNYPLFEGLDPNALLPGGTNIFIPGGEGEIITWNPGRATETNADGSVRTVTFAPGHPGSCGAVEPTSGTVWVNPLPNGQWVRGFYAGHSGLDLSAPTGTPIRAANGGRVVFAGWNRWGYGYAVMIEHGALMATLYGHMNDINVSCGQYINAGDVIGTVGNTGNSSGPHLHFEIRSGDSPTNPSGIPGIGW